MIRIAAFADEISPDLDDQIKTCKANDVTHIELRGVSGKNVMDFDVPLRNEIKAKLAANGMGISAIGSPIGKVKIDEPWPAHFEKFKHAVDLAEFFGAPFVRLFSYYSADKDKPRDILKHRDEVMKRFQQKVEHVKNRNVVLVHENEADIYGERGAECLDLMKTINSPKLKSAFDFANFVMADEHPLDNWKLLKPYSVHIHVKDASLAAKKCVPAGQGDGQIEPILKDLAASGYSGFLTLEPHLAHAGQFAGFTGPDLFKVAVDALKDIGRRNKLPIAGL